MLTRHVFVFLLLFALTGTCAAQPECNGPLVNPTKITKNNYKLCNPAYTFECKKGYPSIPKCGECITYTWDNVPSCDGQTTGSVTVTICVDEGPQGRVVRFLVENGVAKKVFVKGGSWGNVYNYGEGVSGDCGLHPPKKSKNAKKWPNISKVVFCLCFDPPRERCFENESAWSEGTRYEDPGNWATFTEYVPDSTVTLFAGQFFNAGTVHFSTANGGLVTITIELNSGFEFSSDPEAVKVQDYITAPSGNPAPGQFDYKNAMIVGDIATIVVPENNYYGVHVDLLREVDCEPEPALVVPEPEPF
jgi:hypothetical protein